MKAAGFSLILLYWGKTKWTRKWAERIVKNIDDSKGDHQGFKRPKNFKECEAMLKNICTMVIINMNKIKF